MSISILLPLFLLLTVPPAQKSLDLAKAHYEKGAYAEALSWSTAALKEARAALDDRRMMMALNNIGNCQSQMGQSKAALQVYLKALSMSEKIRDEKYVGRILKNIGALYSEQKNFGQASAYYDRCLKIATKIRDNPLLADCLNNIGVIREQEHRFEDAIAAYNRALPIYRRLNDDGSTAMTLNNLAILLKNTGRYAEAAEMYQQALAVSEKMDDAFLAAAMRNNIGNLYVTTGDCVKGLKYCQQANEAAHRINAMEIEIEALDGMASAYEKCGNLKQALAYRKKYEAAHNTYINQENSRQLNELSVKYESGKKAAQITSLKQQEKIHALQLSSERHKTRAISIIGCLLLVTFISAFYLQRTRNRLAAEKLVRHTEEAERRRLARDIHDDLGSGLAKINFLSEVISRGADDQTVKKSTASLQETAIALVENMRDMIWALHIDHATVDQLLSRIREYATNYLETFSINASYDFSSVPEHAWSNRGLNHHVLMVVKEALNNIARHSGATEVSMCASATDDRLDIAITDNGRGFDTEHGGSGNGLKNMARRMTAAGGGFTLSVGNGVTVVISVPLAQTTT